MNLQDDFSDWFKFPDYSKQDGRKLPGVYVLAHFNKKLSSPPLLISKNIIYIGETTQQSIHKRLYQFSNSAFKRKNGHSGGWTYSDKFLNNKSTENIPSNLYVSILPIDRPVKESKAYIKYVERLLIWEYFKTQKDYPACNTA
jgi:hypothetical protein